MEQEDSHLANWFGHFCVPIVCNSGASAQGRPPQATAGEGPSPTREETCLASGHIRLEIPGAALYRPEVSTGWGICGGGRGGPRRKRTSLEGGNYSQHPQGLPKQCLHWCHLTPSWLLTVGLDGLEIIMETTSPCVCISRKDLVNGRSPWMWVARSHFGGCQTEEKMN